MTEQVCKKCGVSKLARSFERLPSGNLRGICHRCKLGKYPPSTPPKKFIRSLNSQRYIITAAQNATPVEAEFFATLKAAAKHLGAELVVIPLRYRNPTSLWSQKQETDEWWDPAVVPYLFNGRKKLHEHLVLAADVKTVPTASSPLTGFESLTGPESCILGHTKMQFRTVPVPTGHGHPKILTTTGACTRKNYTDSKAGKIGAFHHFLGAILVETRGNRFHLRQLNADRADGSFIDLDTLYTTKGVRKAPPALGLVMADTHVRVMNHAADRATFGPRGIVKTLNPEVLVFHDIIDGETHNPHDAGDPFITEAKRKAHRLDIRAEIQEVADFLNARTAGREVVIVDSNHHDFLRRWVVKCLVNGCPDARNADLFLESAIVMRKSARMTPGGARYDSPFPYWLKKLGAKNNIRCLEPNESFRLGDSECGLHGHNGPGGAKGTIKNLSRLGTKVISGHGHSPGVEEGHYRTGGPEDLEYQRGPNASITTHCAVYGNGKRSLISIIGDAWRLI